MMRRNRKPDAGPEMTEVVVNPGSKPVRLPTDALRAISSALLPELMEHGTVSLTIGTPHSEPERPQGLISGSDRRGEPRKLGVMVSVRMDPAALDDIQRLAAADGITSVSEWIRRTAAAAVFEREKPAPVPGYRVTGWQCAHMNMTSGGVEWGSVTAECGCEMQPVYDEVRAA